MPLAELRFVTEGGDVPITGAWVHLKQGDAITVLRTDDQGRAMRLRPGADASFPWEYTERYTVQVPADVELLYGRGARPLPGDLLRQHQAAFVPMRLQLPQPAPPQQVHVAPNTQDTQNTVVVRPLVTVALPPLVLLVTTPRELSLWPLLWGPVEETYYTDGIPQGSGWWSQQAHREEGRPPATQQRPRERGLLVKGTIDPRATGVRIQIWSQQQSRLVKLLESATEESQEGHDYVAAALSAGAKPEDPKTFEKALYFLHPDESFGSVQIVAISEGIQPRQILDGFTSLLVGLQGTLVDDYSAAADGSQRGPQRLETDEQLIVDFTDSPSAGQERSATNRAQWDRGRIRRMVVDPIRASRRRRLARTQTEIVHNEMPLWMAEIHLVGATRDALADLMRRRKRRSAEAPTTLSFSYRWNVRMQWQGPDHATPPNFVYDQTFSGIWTESGLQDIDQTVTLRLNETEALPESEHKAVDPFEPVPVALPFPSDRRRRPEVWLSGQQRRWGQRSGAAERDALVIEWQVAIVQEGNEVIRGGNCTPSVGAFRIDNTRVHPGVRSNGHLFATNTPDVPVLVRRVLGHNATRADAEEAMNAVTLRYYNEHADLTAMRSLRSGVWQQVIRFICTHESRGRQFDDRQSDARFLASAYHLSFGHEKGMPFFGGPRGYGIGQKDPAPPPNAMFNYVEAIAVACNELMRQKVNDANRYLRGLKPTFNLETSLGDRAALLREATRRYNGNREFEFHDGELKIRPNGSRDRREYPNQALQTAVPYHLLDPPPTPRQPPRQPPPQVQVPHHLDWIPAYYGPAADE